MGQWFDQVQLPDWTQINSEFSPDRLNILHNQALASDSAPALAQANTLIAQNTGASGSQDLIDRGTIRQNSLGLAQRNPLSLATVAGLSGVGGTKTINSLSTMDSQTAASKLAAIQFNMGLPQMPGGPAPATAGGAGGGGTAPSGGFMGQMSSTENPGGNPAKVNDQGYSGNFQFGTGRLSDLKLYQPAQGEDPNGNQWQGTFNIPGFPDVKTYADFLHGPVGQDGTRSIQRGADAQRMAAEVHFKDIGQQIDTTPGAQDYNRAGLMAVAQLGGIHGMQKFVATGGQYNPGDNPNAPDGGTHLSQYYTKFSQGGLPAFQNSFGHPAGPLPDNHSARQQVASNAGTAGLSPIANDASSVSGVDGNPAPGSTVSDTPEQLQAKIAQMRANGAAAGAPAAPAHPSAAVQGVNQFLQNQLLPQPGASQPAGATAPAPQPATGAPINSLFAPPAPVANAPRPVIPGSSIMTTAPFADQKFPLSEQGPSSQAVQQIASGSQISAQQSQATPQAAPAGAPAPAPPAAQPFNPMAGLPPGSVPIKTGYGTPYTQNAPAGFAWARTPDGQLAPYSLVPPVLKEVKTPQAIINVDPRTGQEVSRIAIPETGRMTSVETPQGHQNYINGHPAGDPIPFSGRAEQNEAYKSDQKSVSGIIGIAQQAQTIAPRLNEMADLAKQLWTGPTAQSRGNAQAFLETLGVDPAAASKLTGMSSAAAFQEFSKLTMSTAGAAAKDDLGANNGVQALGMYMGSNPNPNLVQGTNVNITNMMRVMNQSKQDYAQAALDHFKTQESGFLGADGKGAKSDTPLTAFNQTWLAQNNPHVYAAAMGMLNGDPYDQWKARLANPSEGARAAAIVSRIDPNAMIPVAGGSIPVRQLLAKVPAAATP